MRPDRAAAALEGQTVTKGGFAMLIAPSEFTLDFTAARGLSPGHGEMRFGFAPAALRIRPEDVCRDARVSTAAAVARS